MQQRSVLQCQRGSSCSCSCPKTVLKTLCLRFPTNQVLRRLQRLQDCSWRLHALDQESEVSAPWNLTFDLRERETEWTEENKARLVALVAAQQLSIPMSEMEQRLDALMLLLPDLAGRVQRLQPSLLAALTADLQTTSSRLLHLLDLMPAANVSRLVADRPQLLLQEPGEVQAAVEELQELLGLENVDRLVEEQPLFLATDCVKEVLAEIRRLMPGRDAAALLVSDPEWLLRVQRGQQWLGLHPDSQLGSRCNGNHQAVLRGLKVKGGQEGTLQQHAERSSYRAVHCRVL